MTRYDFHPEAVDDLVEIWEFIAKDSLAAADRVLAEMLAMIEAAASLPHQGHWRRDLTSRPLRFLRLYEYLVVYAPDEDPLWVVAVLHGRRDPRNMAAILKGRS